MMWSRQRPIVLANWKMHGSRAQLAAYFAELARYQAQASAQIGFCLPFVYLSEARNLCPASFKLGAQNLSQHAQGAYTGEVSAAMLRDVGCDLVLVGHSERRHYHSETDAMVAAKFATAKTAGLIPVLCVGETLAEREAEQTNAVVARQLCAVINLLGVQALQESIIAYEPVWAIGTGRHADPEQAEQVHGYLRSLIARQDSALAQQVPIIYGGSVKVDNATALFAQPNIDGGLVGGASLDAKTFVQICGIINK